MTPVAVFNTQDPWMRQVIREVAPPGFDVRFVDDPAGDPRDLLAAADFLVTVKLPTAWVPHLRRCRLVQLQGVGFDGVDRAGLDRAEVPFALTPEGTVTGVAEHTVMLILALYKRLTVVHDSVRRGEFDPTGWRSKCHTFRGKTLGVVGFGRIGRRVAHLANAFEATTVYHDVAPVDGDEGRYRPFDFLLAEADVVSVHTPLTADTRGRFGRREFARMKRGALFVNTSRGETYDRQALYESLEAGHLGGAGLDVFDPEPPDDHPIVRLPNVICTPHMAAGTVESHQEKAAAQFANFQRVLRGEPPRNLAPPQTGSG
jgi:phosphoglycerate dehydrogenase-like enzyme